jgi:hypothetical protein
MQTAAALYSLLLAGTPGYSHALAAPGALASLAADARLLTAAAAFGVARGTCTQDDVIVAIRMHTPALA